jgi:hypothetical protein
VNFWRQFLDLVDNDERVLEGLIMSAEAHFCLHSYINRISDIAVIRILCRSTRKFSIVKRYPFGVVGHYYLRKTTWPLLWILSTTALYHKHFWLQNCDG